MRATLILSLLISVGCSRTPGPTPAAGESSATEQTSGSDEGPTILVAFPTCRRDYVAMCEEHDANPRVIECLRAHEDELRSSCRAALNPEETPLPPPSRAPSDQGGGGHGGGGGHSH